MKFTQLLASAGVLALSAPLFSSTAQAQDASVQGPGYKVSEGTVMHPTVGAETGFISNVFYEDSTPLAAAVLRLTGNLAFSSTEIEEEEDTSEGSTGEPPKFDFSAGLRMSYEEFLSGDASAQAQRNLGLGGDISLTIFPQGKVRFNFTDNFIRTNRPTNFESSSVLNRDVNHFKASASIQGLESSLRTTFRFENTLDIFESTGSSFANRQQSLLGARVDWQFLPITRFYLDASYGLYSALGNGTKASSTPLRIKTGADSAITESTTLSVHAGFVKGFYSAGADYTAPIYGAEFGLRYSPVGRVTLGYGHDFDDSINGNFYSDHALTLKFDQQISRALVSFKADTRLRTYQGLSMILGGGSTRNDFILGLGADAGYELKEWLALSATYQTQVVATDYRSTVSGVTDDPSFARHTLMVGATAAF